MLQTRSFFSTRGVRARARMTNTCASGSTHEPIALGWVSIIPFSVIGIKGRRGNGSEMLHLPRLHVAARHDIERPPTGGGRRDDAGGNSAFSRPDLLVACVDGLATEHSPQLTVALQRALDRMVHFTVHPDRGLRIGVAFVQSK